MKTMITVMALFLLTSCTSKDPLCATGKVMSGFISAQVSKQLACTNVDAVKASIDAQLVKLKICTQISATGAIGEIICKPVVDSVVSIFLNKIPAEWGCSGGPLTDEAKLKLIEACKKAI